MGQRLTTMTSGRLAFRPCRVCSNSNALEQADEISELLPWTAKVVDKIA